MAIEYEFWPRPPADEPIEIVLAADEAPEPGPSLMMLEDTEMLEKEPVFEPITSPYRPVVEVRLPSTATFRVFERSGVKRGPAAPPNVYPNTKVFMYAEPDSVDRYAAMTFPPGLCMSIPRVVFAGTLFAMRTTASLKTILLLEYVFPATVKSPPSTRPPPTVKVSVAELYVRPESPETVLDAE
jgi:hypothetical protein